MSRLTYADIDRLLDEELLLNEIEIPTPAQVAQRPRVELKVDRRVFVSRGKR